MPSSKLELCLSLKAKRSSTRGKTLADPMLAECMQTKQCSPYKHHYDECAERVQKQEEEGGKAKEDCVEECKSALHHDVMLKDELTTSSLPSHALRLAVRCAEAVENT